MSKFSTNNATLCSLPEISTVLKYVKVQLNSKIPSKF